MSNSVGKLRLAINLHYLNKFLLKDKSKYEDLWVAMSMFQQVGPMKSSVFVMYANMMVS